MRCKWKRSSSWNQIFGFNSLSSARWVELALISINTHKGITEAKCCKSEKFSSGHKCMLSLIIQTRMRQQTAVNFHNDHLISLHAVILWLYLCMLWYHVISCSAKDDYNIDKESYHSLTITSDGNISRYFPTIYKSSCRLEVKNFPFDDQVTTLKIISFSR